MNTRRLFSVTQNGKKLAKSKYSWNEKTRTFSSAEDNLVLDFTDIDGVTFKTGNKCTFKTGTHCAFNTRDNCTFDTGSYCTFDTKNKCTFDTSSYCKFKTGRSCTFDTKNKCTFDTGSYCKFNTGSWCAFNTNNNCTFDARSNCTFDTDNNCTFKTGQNCVIVRRDIFEVIQPEAGFATKLNGENKKGFTLVKDTRTITIDGKDIEISIESFNNLKKQLSKD